MRPSRSRPRLGPSGRRRARASSQERWRPQVRRPIPKVLGAIEGCLRLERIYAGRRRGRARAQRKQHEKSHYRRGAGARLGGLRLLCLAPAAAGPREPAHRAEIFRHAAVRSFACRFAALRPGSGFCRRAVRRPPRATSLGLGQRPHRAPDNRDKAAGRCGSVEPEPAASAAASSSAPIRGRGRTAGIDRAPCSAGELRNRSS